MSRALDSAPLCCVTTRSGSCVVLTAAHCVIHETVHAMCVYFPFGLEALKLEGWCKTGSKSVRSREKTPIASSIRPCMSLFEGE